MCICCFCISLEAISKIVYIIWWRMHLEKVKMLIGKTVWTDVCLYTLVRDHVNCTSDLLRIYDAGKMTVINDKTRARIYLEPCYVICTSKNANVIVSCNHFYIQYILQVMYKNLNILYFAVQFALKSINKTTVLLLKYNYGEKKQW